jgi:predicted transcriptional regulator
MSKLARVTITLPKDLLAAADARARHLDRSRSWVVAEALRPYLPPDGVREPVHAHGAREVAEARRRHLIADLQLAPAERLHQAEDIARLARTAKRRGRRSQVIGFDSYEDYYEWKKAHRAGA